MVSGETGNVQLCRYDGFGRIELLMPVFLDPVHECNSFLIFCIDRFDIDRAV